MSNFDGKIKIILEEKDKKTAINEIYYEGVSKVSPTMYLDDEEIPCYFLMHMGGGYVEGERCSNYIEIKKGARSIITTQAPTLIYKCENGIPCEQYSMIKLEENSVLEYMLDNTILFKDAIYQQKTDIYMEKNSTLIYTDGITSGWSPDGAKFQYDVLRMKNRIFMDGELVFLDNLLLDPKNQELEELGFLEGYSNYGTAIIIDRRIDDTFVEKLREEIEGFNLDINFGISGLEVNGFVIRVIGNRTQHIQKALYACVNYVRKELFESCNLYLRKY
ncbi:urease accessory protein UreD [Clostridium sardiniense]|uniref:urease accessory protein UreD n=1 Tax=Clostridium sardiniense TaxID=29369 RepID=UPI003D33EC74